MWAEERYRYTCQSFLLILNTCILIYFISIINEKNILRKHIFWSKIQSQFIKYSSVIRHCISVLLNKFCLVTKYLKANRQFQTFNKFINFVFTLLSSLSILQIPILKFWLICINLIQHFSQKLAFSPRFHNAFYLHLYLHGH